MLSRNRFALIGAGTVAAIGGAAYVACACTLGPPSASFPCTPTAFDANNPAGSGYQVTFQTNFQTAGTSTIDMNNTQTAGFQWYLRQLFGGPVVSAASITTDANGIVIDPNLGPGAVEVLHSLINGSGNFWRGTAFGGGAFFEINWAFDGTSVANCFTAFTSGNCGWPAFWSMALEHILTSRATDAQWPGQAAGYEHFIENDFFEFDIPSATGNQGFGSALVDWSGVGGSSNCPTYTYTGPGYCGLLNNGDNGVVNNVFICKNAACTGVTWNEATFHNMGSLWVAADANNGQIGYRRQFIDGVEMVDHGSGNPSKVSWSKTTMPTPAALPGSPQTWSIHDYQRLGVIVSSGDNNSHNAGTNQRLHVKYIKVWQIPGCGTTTAQ